MGLWGCRWYNQLQWDLSMYCYACVKIMCAGGKERAGFGAIWGIGLLQQQLGSIFQLWEHVCSDLSSQCFGVSPVPEYACYIIVYIMIWCVMITFDFHFEPIVVVWYDLCFNGPFVTAAFNHAQGEDEGLNRIYGCSGRTNPWKSNGTGWQRPPLRVMENRESFPGFSGWAGHAFSLHPVR